MNSWFNSLALVFGLARHKEQKKEREQKEFLESRKTDLCAASERLFEEIEQLTTACGPVGLPGDFAEESKLILLYAAGEVLSAQGMAAAEQELFLKIWISHVNPMFNYAQFVQATVFRTGVYEQLQEIIGLSRKICGSFWRTLLEMVYRSRRVDLPQIIGDCLVIIVWNFSYLAGRNPPFAETISKRLFSDLEYWANAYQQTPYIHALMLLQNRLRDEENLDIERQLLLRGDDMQKDTRHFFVFCVFERTGEDFFENFRGEYAVKALRSLGEELDYEHDKDLILHRENSSEEFSVFYDELSSGR